MHCIAIASFAHPPGHYVVFLRCRLLGLVRWDAFRDSSAVLSRLFPPRRLGAKIAGPSEVEHGGSQFQGLALKRADVTGAFDQVARLAGAQLSLLRPVAFEQPFDAIIGRYVLLFQKNPTQMLQKLVPHVKLGGVIAFHEPNVVAHSYPVSPMWDRCCQWVAETFRQNSTEMQMGSKLFSTFLAVGLPPPEVRVEAILRGGANSYDLVNWIVGLVGTLLPSMERLGIVGAADVDLETLAARMTDEIVANASVVMRHLEVGAWCRK